MPGRPALVRPRPGVLWREIEGEAVLLDPRSSIYFSLNAVGTRVWSLLEEGLPLDRIHAALYAEYEVEAEALWQDLEEILRRLAAEGLVELEPEVEAGVEVDAGAEAGTETGHGGAGGGKPGDGRSA